MKFKKNILLKNYTTFQIGGKAKYFFKTKNKKDLILAIDFVKKNKLPFFVLSGGSNLLVSDKGFNGIIIRIENCKLKIENCKVDAGAGLPLSKLINISIEKGLTGLEWLVGIPGKVGGAIFGNAGAFGKSMKDIIKEVEVFDINDLRFKIYNKKDCKFNYRDSVFKKRKNLIIFSAEIILKKGNKKEIKNKIKEYLNYKKTTQPLNFPSAGSVFKNFTPYRPALYKKLTEIKRQIISSEGGAGTGPEELKELKKIKKTGVIPAAWLIEKCNLKGKKIGKVKISEKHANFIVNLGKAKAEDVKKLIELIKKRVKNKFKIILEEEIQFLGF